MTTRSPRILSISWGSITVDGHGEFKDAKLWPGGARAWDWDETGTRHSPGTQPADVEELLEAGATVIVLSRGMEERLGVAPATLALLEEHGVEVHVAETSEAVALYNELVDTAAVAGLFHSTC
ncbi:Mth938-like domain-containing protein [Dactylosporangium sp. NPDC000244]|uniref:Mth938-like domain-containing protein n=1 Tax=Dactylosporangium sp. NPDC000244 TaxID=3154365 RepID=UPI00333475A8